MQEDSKQTYPKIFHSLSFHDSSIYFSGLDNSTYAIDEHSGKLLWRHDAQSYSLYKPEFGQNNQLFSTNFDGNLYAVNTYTGDEIWRFLTPDRTKIDTEPIQVGNDVLFGSRNGSLYAVNKSSGTLHWIFKTKQIDKSLYRNDEAIFHFGLFSTDKEQVYLNSATEHKIFAINLKTGSEAWNIVPENYYFNKPEIYESSIGLRNSPTSFWLIDKATGKILNDIKVPENNLYVSKHCIFVIDSNTDITCINPNTGVKQWTYSKSYNSPINITAIRPGIVAVTSLNMNATIVTMINVKTGEELWSQSFSYSQKFWFHATESLVFVIGQDIQCSLSLDGDIKWCTKRSVKEHVSFLTKQGIYILSKNGEYVRIDNINLQSGASKWMYLSKDINIETVKEYHDNIYFLNKKNDLVKLNGSFPKKIITDTDIKSNSVSNNVLLDIYKLSHYIEVSLQRKYLTVSQPPAYVDKNGIFEISVNTNKPQWKENQVNTSYSLHMISPSGTPYKIKGFYYDLKTWKFRFSPREIGEWKWSIDTDSKTEINLSTGRFQVLDSLKTGFLSISKHNPKYFSKDNGNIFIPIGIQNCVIDLHHDGNPLYSWPLDDEIQGSQVSSEYKTTSMHNYVSSYAKSGFNLYRWGAGNCTFALWNFGKPNSFGPMANEGYFLDTILSELRENNFHVWISLLSFDLPYDTSLSMENQQKILAQYLDYIIARYGSMIDVWELANEIRLSDELIRFMAGYILSNDPYKHPITTSWERPDLSEIEITSFHWYSGECNEFCDEDLSREVSKFTKYNKPLVFSEQGNSFVNWDSSSSVRFRLRLWLGFFQQSFSIFWNMPSVYFQNKTGPSNIYLGPVERLYTSVFSKLTETIGADIQKQEISSSDKHHKVYAISSGDEIYGYIYTKIFDFEKSSTTISFNAKTDGVIQWISPETGEILYQQRVTKGKVNILTPSFSTDLIFKYTK